MPQLSRSCAIVDFDTPLLGKRISIEDANLIRPVAHEDFLAVSCEPPSFTGVGESTKQLEVACAVDESYLRLPCELDEFIPEQRDAFAEELWRQVNWFNHLSRFETNLAQ